MQIKNEIVTFEELEKQYSTYITNPADRERIKKAYEFAEKKHEGQFRKSGDPYITHCLGVAMILACMQTSPVTIMAGLLHDTIEDTGTTREEIASTFGEEVAFLVEGLTKITRLSDFHNSDFQAEDHRKIFLAMAADIRVIIIKLADRLHNMRTLQFQPREKQIRISKETLDVYVPIAHRLGLNSVMSEMQDLALYYSEPEKYAAIEKKVEELNINLNASLERIKAKVVDILSKANIPFEVSARIKSIYSIYRKMYLKHKKFEEIYDILALRIITETETNCYEILGYIHSQFIPVPGRFKDYIAMPKPNMYQSLHTTILSGDGNAFEIQIRTREMDEIAEGGVAAHWRYKEGTSYDPKQEQHDIEEQLHWFKDFVNMTEMDRTSNVSAKEYENQLKQDVFEANVYVFTPKGKVIDLPKGATPIDFAYKIHTDVGNTLAGAKVNGRLVPLSTKLRTGDMVEAITKKDASPNAQWLQIAGSSFAKAHIRKYLAKQNDEFIRNEQIEKGRQSLHDALRERKLTNVPIDRLMDDPKVFANFKVNDVNELYLKIFNRNILPGEVFDFLNLSSAADLRQAQYAEEMKKNSAKKADVEDAVLLPNGDTAMISLANCCRPIPGDEIVGYVSKGRGIKVHRRDCPNIRNEDSRLVEVVWNPNLDKSKKYPVDLTITASDRNGLLVDVMNAISSNAADLVNVSAKVNSSTSVCTILATVKVSDADMLSKLMKALEGVKLVQSVARRMN